MAGSPRVLHLNDCAFVGQHIVDAARPTGRPWRIIPPERSWPKLAPGETIPTKFALGRTFVRIGAYVQWSEVVHVHFATTTSRILPWFIPTRPYVLHLHGSDIRTRWKNPGEHPKIQSYIDGAAHVFYSTRDLEGDATTARADAEYFPTLVDPAGLPAWRPEPYVAFASRWESVKGVDTMLEVASRLIRAGIQVRGLDWGDGAQDAAERGVRLLPRMSHPDYLDYLSRASVVVGQANTVVGVSELEAMAIGVPLAAVGSHLPGPDGGPLPIREGGVDDVVEQILIDVADPGAAAAQLDGAAWTRRWHTAERYLPRLDATYLSAVAQGR